MKGRINKMLGTVIVAVLAFVGATDARAQKNNGNGLAGVWIMESMQWEGERKVMCGKESSYSQVKFYGKDGEYACAEIVRTKDKKYIILPHEYGTYSYVNGKYTEMGRTEGGPEALVLNGDTFTGRWRTRHDVWRRCKNMPKELLDEIIIRCKAHQEPSAEIQSLIRKNFFER